MKNNKLLFITVCCLILVSGITSCKKYIDDAFANPNKPVVVDPEVVLPAVISNFARGLFFDARYVGNYTSYWHRTVSGVNSDRMGYYPGSDAMGEKWRTHYWNLGQNLLNVIRDSREAGKPEYIGASYALFALSWLQLADYHGEVILDEAFRTEQLTFKYNTQEEVYDYVKKICDSAIIYFNQASSPSSGFGAVADKFFYGGNIDRWKKFVYGVKALTFHRYYLKSNYSADSVIINADLSFGSATDDAMIKFDESLVAISTAALNFYGPRRANLGGYRAGKYLMEIFNGDVFFSGVIDPRRGFLFKPSTSGQYNGLPPNNGFTGITTANQPPNFWGFYSTGSPAGGIDTGSRTYFKNASPFPILTYSMIQFAKAEAALKKGAPGVANTAYLAAINGSFDHLASYTGYIPITAAAKNAYITNAAVAPATLTLSHIMMQKYVSLWPYGMEEIWVDMRRHRYDPNVFIGFTPVASLYPDNNNKLAERVRPRYNSEYLWNVSELTNIGATALDYHTVPVWFSKP